MKQLCFVGFGVALSLAAQTGGPVLAPAVNGSRSAEVAQGSPILVRVMLLHPERMSRSQTTPALRLAPAGLAWADAIQLQVRDEQGGEQTWPLQLLAAPESAALDLPHRSWVEAEWAMTGEQSRALAAGAYRITAKLDIRGGQGWNGSASSAPVTVRIVEDSELTPALAVRAALTGAHVALRRRELGEASRHIDRVLRDHPQSVLALRLKAELLELQGNRDMALLFSTLALEAAIERNPERREPPAELLRLRDRVLSPQLSP